MSALKYQPHIDGLRAIAVLSVIIFHLNAAWLPGGFVGVDFFFVISGFLITGIILTEKDRETFNYRSFYLRRLKRIFPVLAVVVIACFIAGYLLFLNYDFRYLRHSGLATWFFYSNLFFMGEGDYFSPSLLEAPLLHTWSLSIEEQFYFIWPLVLGLLYRFRRQAMLPAAMVLLALSFGFSVAATFASDLAVKSYFLLPSRFWELLLGGVLAMLLARPGFVASLASFPRLVALLPVMALVLLVYSLLMISEGSSFPGYQAAFPCLSAALFILSGIVSPRHVLVRVLQSGPIVRVGLLSYSLYLWHWPVLAFIRYVTIEAVPGLWWTVLAILLTTVLSMLTYRYVEQPFRQVKWSFKKALLLVYVLPFVVLALMDQVYVKVLDKATLHHTENLISDRIKAAMCPQGIAKGCKLGHPDHESPVILTGDSHAEHLVPFFDKLGRQGGWSMKVFSKYGCVSFLGIPEEVIHSDRALERKYCPVLHQQVLGQLASGPHTLVLASRWSIHAGINDEPSSLGQAERRRIFEAGLVSLTSQGHAIILVSEVPAYNKSVQRKKAYPELSGSLARVPEYKDNNAFLRALADRHDNIYYMDVSRFAERFEDGLYEGRFVYFDSNHLTYDGSLILADMVLNEGDELVGLRPLLAR